MKYTHDRFLFVFIDFDSWLLIVSNSDWRLAVIPCLIGSAICGILFFLFGKSWPSEIGLAPLGADELMAPF